MKKSTYRVLKITSLLAIVCIGILNLAWTSNISQRVNGLLAGSNPKEELIDFTQTDTLNSPAVNVLPGDTILIPDTHHLGATVWVPRSFKLIPSHSISIIPVNGTREEKWERYPFLLSFYGDKSTITRDKAITFLHNGDTIRYYVRLGKNVNKRYKLTLPSAERQPVPVSDIQRAGCSWRPQILDLVQVPAQGRVREVGRKLSV